MSLGLSGVILAKVYFKTITFIIRILLLLHFIHLLTQHLLI